MEGNIRNNYTILNLGNAISHFVTCNFLSCNMYSFHPLHEYLHYFTCNSSLEILNLLTCFLHSLHEFLHFFIEVSQHLTNERKLT